MAQRFLAMLFISLVAVGALGSETPGAAKTGGGKTGQAEGGFRAPSTIHDLGWTTAHYKGIEYLKKEMKDQIVVDYTENVLAADTERVVRNYAKNGYRSFSPRPSNIWTPRSWWPRIFPRSAFEHCSGYKTGPNMGNYFARMEQAEYLAGYTAGLMGYKNVGTVATQPIPEPIRGINAFTLGLLRGLKEGNHPHDPAQGEHGGLVEEVAGPHQRSGPGRNADQPAA